MRREKKGTGSEPQSSLNLGENHAGSVPVPFFARTIKPTEITFMQCCKTLLLSFVTALFATLAACPAGDLASLPVLQDAYPALSSSAAARRWRNPRTAYEAWDRCFSRLMGIEGKVLDEELPNTAVRNIEFFTRFKQNHPDQLVMLHYNGNARDPRFEIGKFFAGHWLYYEGARITADISAEPGETEISVQPPGTLLDEHRPLPQRQ